MTGHHNENKYCRYLVSMNKRIHFSNNMLHSQILQVCFHYITLSIFQHLINESINLSRWFPQSMDAATLSDALHAIKDYRLSLCVDLRH